MGKTVEQKFDDWFKRIRESNWWADHDEEGEFRACMKWAYQAGHRAAQRDRSKK